MSVNELKKNIYEVFLTDPDKLVISKPRKSEGVPDEDMVLKKLVVERIAEESFQMSKYTEKQVFHKNYHISEKEELTQDILRFMEAGFMQLNAWSAEYESMLMISKKGKIGFKKKRINAECGPSKGDVSRSHNREKKYLLREGNHIEPLIDMGIFTKEGKVKNSMYDKFRQINRYIEIIDDEVKGLTEGKNPKTNLNIIDFGCGKSYLTFLVYYYLTEIRGISTRIIGLDLKKDVIENCNKAAEKYGYEGLSFELGDINGYEAPFDVDMVMTLHACDTATDYALYNAVKWKAGLIFSVPCCQHELNNQMAPENFEILSKYGIIKERFSALATDAIRANLLQYSGYKTQLLEFIDMEHTPKNILIRAVRRPMIPGSVKNSALSEVEALMKEFKFEPTLYRLLALDDSSEA